MYLRSRRSAVSAALVGLLTAALVGCGAEENSGGSAVDGSAVAAGESPSESSSPAQSVQLLTTDTFLPAVMKALEGRESAHLSMELNAAGQLIHIVGDTSMAGKTPVLKMTMSGDSVGGRIEMRLVDEVLYASVPQLTPGGKFVAIDATDPSDPLGKQFSSMVKSADATATFDAFEAGMRKVEHAGEETVDGEVLQQYTVTVDTKAALKAQGQPTNVPGLPKTIDYQLWLDEQDLLRRLAFDLGEVSVTGEMSDWGKPVLVKAPAPSKIVESPQTARR